MRAGRVRVLFGVPRRDARMRMPGPGRPGRRSGPRDRRGDRLGRVAASGAGGVRRGGCGSVWLLHPGPDRRHARPLAPGAAADHGPDSRGARGQHLPLHGLRQDHRGGAPGGGPYGLDVTTRPRLATPSVVSGRVGDAVQRPDAALKTRGDFPYSSDLQVEGMLWGATVRSPHPYARIVSIDAEEARPMPGVKAVLTHEDVPGHNVYGLEIEDQPVLAVDVVRYWGEAVRWSPRITPSARDALRTPCVSSTKSWRRSPTRRRRSPTARRGCTPTATSRAGSRSGMATRTRARTSW